MSVNGHQAAIELETFLPPQEGTEANSDKGGSAGATRWNNRQVVDSQLLNVKNHDGRGRWDPFKDRDTQPHATTNCDTLTHLLKAALGTGIIAMPVAFKYSGLVFGVIATVAVSVICTHCSYIVVKCAHELYHRTRVSAMTFADVGEIAFASGPPWGKKFSKLARKCIEGGLIAAYFGACSAYCVFIAGNLQKVFEHYFSAGYGIRSYVVSLWIPLVLLCWTPNLKKLTPVSMVANLLMAIGLILTFYFLVWDLRSVSELPKMAPLDTLPHFFSITIFALEVIGVVMPLENAMKTPKQFVGLCGVLNQGMGGVTLIFIFLGFLGYLKYGENTQDSITFNLPTESILAQIIQVCVALSVFCTYGLQYFVFLEIIWNGLKDKFKNTRAAEYVVRTILTSCTVILAVTIPTISPFIGLIGALCFSFLGLIIPVIVEIITFWDKGFGPYYWLLWKSIILFVFGMLAMFSGSYVNILEIIKIYKN